MTHTPTLSTSRPPGPPALPDARALLADLAAADATMHIHPTTATLRITALQPIPPNLRHRLAATKPAWLAAARGHCAWCHHNPPWCHDHDTGWPTCHPCAIDLGTTRLHAEHPDRPDLWQTADP